MFQEHYVNLFQSDEINRKKKTKQKMSLSERLCGPNAKKDSGRCPPPQLNPALWSTYPFLLATHQVQSHPCKRYHRAPFV